MPRSPHRAAAMAGTGRRLRAMVLAGATAVALAACAPTGPTAADRTMPAASGNSSAAVVSSAPLETAQATSKVPVYWLGHSGSEVYLYREFLTANSTADPIEAALAAMTGQKPLDPDYFSPWKQPSKLGVSISGRNLITVDISSDAFAPDVDQGIAERAISQLVYTASAAAASAGLIDGNIAVQVSILVDGHTDYVAFGKVPLSAPLTRTAAFIAPTWITDPQNGTNESAPLTVSGQGVSATGRLSWQLVKKPVTSTSTNTPSGPPEVYLSGEVAITAGPAQLGKYEFMLNPPAGNYELRVFTPDPADPARQLGLDTKAIFVG
ncbi:GerMN domain-containing protein [Arthrobacter sp. 35W]|uniref:GerMN domain-containing protein n=1 Tax=Arthrobacter sp. 35W TaxID=1132441 RepID=UPI00041F5EF1|nr:GerMN domain-containing protein [Arthrobacter sp. 35W]